MAKIERIIFERNLPMKSYLMAVQVENLSWFFFQNAGMTDFVVLVANALLCPGCAMEIGSVMMGVTNPLNIAGRTAPK